MFAVNTKTQTLMEKKAIFIDAHAQKITEILLSTQNTLKEVYSTIGNNCDIIEMGCYLKGNDGLMVDGEGYFKEGLCGFYIFDVGFFYGNGLIMGADELGELDDFKTNFYDVKKMVTFIDKDDSAIIRDKVLNNPQFLWQTK